MTIANDIISRRIPDFDFYIKKGDSLDDIDEYGFTPLIETAITRQPETAKLLLARKVDVNKPDVAGRTALHWAADRSDVTLCQLLLEAGADPNAYTTAGLSVLVYPLLRGQDALKQLLYQYGAKIDFALDFIYGKLLGHRFELQGDVDIVNTKNEFIELNYEGFILEFTVALMRDALRRFTSSFSTRHLRQYFPKLYVLMDAFGVAEELLALQRKPASQPVDVARLKQLMQSPMLVLPAASQGHALGFVRYGKWWAKIDRGENSHKEGSVNLYEIGQLDAFNEKFLQQFLYKKQPRSFFHQTINDLLSLKWIAQLPITSQISGNCSWANIQAIIPAAYVLQDDLTNPHEQQMAMDLFDAWTTWDQDRALDECIQRFYLSTAARQASMAAMLADVLFQSTDAALTHHLERAEKILKILTLPEYEYILNSYLEVFCVKRLTRRGNNLLKILEDCGINSQINVHTVATGLKKRV